MSTTQPHLETEAAKIKRLERTNGILMGQVKMLAKINADLEHENTILNQYIIQQKRLRHIIKNLIQAIDKIIVLHLSKIAKRPHYYPPLHITGEALHDPTAMLKVLQAGDIESLNGSPSLMQKFVNYFGGVTLFVYIRIRRLLFKVAKVCIKGLRRLLGKGK
jgi:hypothetical protein